MRKKAPRLDKHVNKDVVLCSTTNRRVSNHTTDILLQDAIPFTKNWNRIPFYKREEYRGADQICVFSINRNLYSRARRCISQLDHMDQNRLLLHVI